MAAKHHCDRPLGRYTKQINLGAPPFPRSLREGWDFDVAEYVR
jgi:hypothetical protein